MGWIELDNPTITAEEAQAERSRAYRAAMMERNLRRWTERNELSEHMRVNIAEGKRIAESVIKNQNHIEGRE